MFSLLLQSIWISLHQITHGWSKELMSTAKLLVKLKCKIFAKVFKSWWIAWTLHMINTANTLLLATTTIGGNHCHSNIVFTPLFQPLGASRFLATWSYKQHHMHAHLEMIMYVCELWWTTYVPSSYCGDGLGTRLPYKAAELHCNAWKTTI